MAGNYMPEENRIGFKNAELIFAFLPKETVDKKIVWFKWIFKIEEIVTDYDSFTSKVFNFFGLGYLSKKVIYYKEML